MSVQEFEQADAEVMAVVNGHANPEAEKAAEEILQEQQGMSAGDSSAAVPPQNDTSSTAQARSPFPRGEGLGGEARGPRGEGLGERIATSPAAPRNDTEEGAAPMREAKAAGVCKEDPEAAARHKLYEEELAEMENRYRRKKNRRTVLCVVLCVLIAAALLVTLAKPELLVWLVSLGVISCSVVAGIAIDRWARRKVW